MGKEGLLAFQEKRAHGKKRRRGNANLTHVTHLSDLRGTINLTSVQELDGGNISVRERPTKGCHGSDYGRIKG